MDHKSCLHASGSQSCHQTLDELEFERGIWKAAVDGDLSRITKLIRKDDIWVNKTDKNGYTALHYAARAGHLDICEHLISHGADVNALLNSGDTALHRACYAGKADIVKLLLKSGAVSRHGDRGQTPLHKAAQQNHYGIVETLLRESPDLLEQTDCNGVMAFNLTRDTEKFMAIVRKLGL